MGYQPKQVEEHVLDVWKTKNTYAQSKARNKGKKSFTFLQGPPYTSGNLHIGHAWNGSLKDVILRYKRAKGFDVWDRSGYDMHGLPTENKVQKTQGLKHKEDIEKFGVEKFIQQCKEFTLTTANQMSQDFAKLGIWMDWQDPYMPITNEFIQNEWWLVKKAYENGRLYKAKKVMTWDAPTETSLAKHELEYKTINDQSIFVKFKLEQDPSTSLIIWTTTPWTIPFNLGVMVNPDVEYVKVKVDDEHWVVAKDLAADLLKKVKHEVNIIHTYKGNELEGWKYIHPLSDLINFDQEDVEIDAQKVHTVLCSAEHVETTSGSGLVHCAPGCGPEDYEVGRQYGLGPFNKVNEQGLFEQMGELNGKQAKVDDKFFIRLLKDKDALAYQQPISHEYPHGWRSHEPVIFRSTNQWFFKTEDLKEKLIAANQQVNWVPKFGKQAFDSWVNNLRDNSITRQRYWGCPVPIWVNEQDDQDIIVIGSAQELKDLGADVPENLHRPYIDNVIINKEGKTYRRIPDVLDVWIDSGTLSWNCFNYPLDQETIKGHQPVDLVLEATEQIRLWFSMLQVCHYLTNPEDTKPVFKNVYMTGMMLDFQGTKMSKSLGNVVSPNEVVDKYGTDVLRYYMCGSPAGQNINFQWEEVKTRYRNLSVHFNIAQYIIDAIQSGTELIDIYDVTLDKEEAYIVSLTQLTIQRVEQLLDEYQLDKAINAIMDLVLELSRGYMQYTRTKLNDQPEKVISTIAYVFTQANVLLSLYCPFITEYVHEQLREYIDLPESVHLQEFPIVNEAWINQELTDQFAQAQNIMQAILATREKAKINVRWPVGNVVVQGNHKTIEVLGDLIKQHTNVKHISSVEKFDKMNYQIKPNFREVGKTFGAQTSQIVKAIQEISDPQALVDTIENGFMIQVDGHDHELQPQHVEVNIITQDPYVYADSVFLDTTRTPELDKEGYVREVIRRIQQFRKDLKLSKADSLNIIIQSEGMLHEALQENIEYMQQSSGTHITLGHVEQAQVEDTIKDQSFSLCKSS